MRSLRLLSFSLIIVIWSCYPAGRSVVAISTMPGTRLQIQAEIADSPAERERGLMHRRDLPPGHGMLFIFPIETRSSFWMKNTPIALDLIFIRKGRVVDVIEKAVPFSEALLSPQSAYDRVLEVNAGFVARNKITPGLAVECP